MTGKHSAARHIQPPRQCQRLLDKESCEGFRNCLSSHPHLLGVSYGHTNVISTALLRLEPSVSHSHISLCRVPLLGPASKSLTERGPLQMTRVTAFSSPLLLGFSES